MFKIHHFEMIYLKRMFSKVGFGYINHYFNLHICLSKLLSVCPSVGNAPAFLKMHCQRFDDRGLTSINFRFIMQTTSEA